MSESLLHDYEGFCRRAVEAMAASAGEVEIPDPKARWHRGGAHACRAAVERLAIACFDPDSPRRGDEALWRRLVQAADALAAFQHEDGFIDLSQSNLHSPPDTAFLVEDLVPLCEVLRAAEPSDRLWPHESWRAEAQRYLDEGIDIDADGEFSERSTGCYNYVCDLALILIGRALGRDEYIDYADRNLEHMLWLLHPDGTLVTDYSRRQDRDQAVGVEHYLLLYWYRALMRGDGRFLAAAELGLKRMAGGGQGLGRLAKWLRYFSEAGERPVPAPEPLPAEYEKRFDGVGVLRRRAGTQSLTLMAGSADVLAMRFGVACEADALSLRLRTEGCPRVPIEVALPIRLAEGVEPAGEVEPDETTGKTFLNSGELVVRGRDHVLRVGPGSAEHDLTQISCGEAIRRPDVYCIRLVTPVDATLTVRAEQV